ncbi:IclR family transcriptional regulator [Klebsiella pneumoniae]|uniref:IclR family transcriptional regulator n=1 Tax=Klebsiella pneumoniae TaxID=573 RepID=UPI001ABD2EAE|nr:IclR family transcriptional regulator [Klebsiella pneumoniae]MBO3721276.1 IclR family transcriptional regulator [Klebsiella pneumoniae]HCM5830602.1 IclR family transcriptional regulator [Klebsiella pneumoniae]
MESDKNGKQVINRAASILKVLGRFQTGLSMSALARECGLPRSTVHRMVAALEEQELVINMKDGIRLGPALLTLATAAHTDFVTVARAVVESLGRRTRETVDVSVYKGMHAISIDQYQSDQELRVVSPVGTAFPVHITAHGKAMLSLLSESSFTHLLRELEDMQLSQTLYNVKSFKQEIINCRVNGYSLDIEGHAEGVCGLGIAIHCGINMIYALSLAVPVQRFKKNKIRLVAELMKAKAEIEAILSQKSK